MALPDSYASPDGLAYFSQCERNLLVNVPLGEPIVGVVNVYARPDGDEVIAWWYIECGYPEGLVAVEADRPNNCGSTDTSGVDTAP